MRRISERFSDGALQNTAERSRSTHPPRNQSDIGRRTNHLSAGPMFPPRARGLGHLPNAEPTAREDAKSLRTRIGRYLAGMTAADLYVVGAVAKFRLARGHRLSTVRRAPCLSPTAIGLGRPGRGHVARFHFGTPVNHRYGLKIDPQYWPDFDCATATTSLRSSRAYWGMTPRFVTVPPQLVGKLFNVHPT